MRVLLRRERQKIRTACWLKTAQQPEVVIIQREMGNAEWVTPNLPTEQQRGSFRQSTLRPGRDGHQHSTSGTVLVRWLQADVFRRTGSKFRHHLGILGVIWFGLHLFRASRPAADPRPQLPKTGDSWRGPEDGLSCPLEVHYHHLEEVVGGGQPTSTQRPTAQNDGRQHEKQHSRQRGTNS